MASNTHFVYSGPDPYIAERKQMVSTQIANRGVFDTKILGVMENLPRHLFMDPRDRKAAYEDCPVSIACGQTISQPYIVAKIAELLDLTGAERVLEIGSGCGYQAAVLSQLAGEVRGVEFHRELALLCESHLKELGIRNVKIRYGDGKLGWKEHAPYDRILFSCAIPEIPTAVKQQLRPGGLVVYPLQLATRQVLMKGDEEMFGVRFVPLL